MTGSEQIEGRWEFIEGVMATEELQLQAPLDTTAPALRIPG